MRADGSHKRRLIHTPAPEFAPSFSPSGRKVVFASHGSGRTGIFTIRLDRTHLKKVTAGAASDPQFSPNGNEIVFERGCEIALMRANGSDEHPLTNQVDGSCDANPDFSPDGRSIVFARDNESIYVVDRDGNGLAQLAGRAGVHDDDPAFSPNGRKIAFDSDQNQPAGANAIYTMRLDGSNVRRLTFGSRSAVESSWGVRPS